MAHPDHENRHSGAAAFIGEQRYQKLKSVGKGAYATVYCCQDKNSGAHVALKAVARAQVEWNERSVANLWKERDVLKAISPPGGTTTNNSTGCVRLLDTFTTKTDVCLVLELVEGATLWEHQRKASAFLAAKKPEQLEDPVLKAYRERYSFEKNGLLKARCCIAQIANALAYLHSSTSDSSLSASSKKPRIAYRDLKPTNVLVGAGEKQLKLTDFGFATDEVDCVCPVGTLRCMAPEVVNFEEDSPPPEGEPEGTALPKRHYDGLAADVWSFGVLSYELCSGGEPLLQGYLEDLHLDRENYNNSLKDARSKIRVGRDENPLGTESSTLFEFLEFALVPDPKARPRMEDVLKHAFLGEASSAAVRNQLEFDRELGFHVADSTEDDAEDLIFSSGARATRSRAPPLGGGGGPDPFQGF